MANHSELVSGNEAIFKAIIDSNAKFASSYPGTPVSEVGDLLYKWSNENKDENFIFDYAINEIVALEETIGAAWTGLRSAVIFKHLGMNVVADALHSIMYSGIDPKFGGGMVMICGGDPQSSSSTNAVDVRVYSKHSHSPILFPSTVQELYFFTQSAFELSESIGLPVMVYTTPKLNFASSIIKRQKKKSVKIHSKPQSQPHPEFHRNFERYVNAIHYAMNNQKKLLSKIDLMKNTDFFETKADIKIESQNENQNGNENSDVSIPALIEITQSILKYNSNIGIKPIDLKIEDHTDYAIITGGIPFLYIVEFLRVYNLEDKIPILKLNQIYPINSHRIMKFIEDANPQQLIIIEEQEPFIEEQVKIILYDNGINKKISGKSIFPRYGELTPKIISGKMSSILSSQFTEINSKFRAFDESFERIKEQIPIREPTFCPGCSHRNVFYALRIVADTIKREKSQEIIFGGDIGCYTMGMSQPYSVIDWLISMGAGIGIANGVGRVFSKWNVKHQKIVALIGDSTFFHSGIQGLLNILKMNLPITVIILNNYYVAMTGHQPTFTTNITDSCVEDSNVGFQHKKMDLAKFLKDIGVTDLTVLDGYSIKTMTKQLKKILMNNGSGAKNTKVVLVNAECALVKRRNAKIKWNKPRNEKLEPETYLYISESCPKCHECYVNFGCTAIKSVPDSETEFKYVIDESACMKEYCMSCIDVCPNHCIERVLVNSFSEREKKDKSKNQI